MTNFNNTHVLFLVDNSCEASPNIAQFIRDLRCDMEGDFSFDIVSFNRSKIRNRVISNQGTFRFATSKSAERHIYTCMKRAIDELGHRIDTSSTTPKRVLVMLITAGVDSTGDEDARLVLAQKISEQYYIYKWRFAVVGFEASEVGQALELLPHMSINGDLTDSNTIEACRKIIDDIHNYGDCGFLN